MSGFLEDGYEAYVEAITEQFSLRASQVEAAAREAADAGQAAALRRTALELRAELERRLGNARISFF